MKKKSLLPLLLILLLLLLLIGAALFFVFFGADSSPAAFSPSSASQGAGVSDAGPVFAAPQQPEEYRIDETWTVDGQWALTVTGVRESQGRNESSDKNPAAVYIVDYTYTNLGYIDETGLMDGLFISMSDAIVDAEGVMGYDYPGHISDHTQQAPVGASCNAQACIGVDNPGDFTVTVSRYDGEGERQSAVFLIEIPDSPDIEPEIEDAQTDNAGSDPDVIPVIVQSPDGTSDQGNGSSGVISYTIIGNLKIRDYTGITRRLKEVRSSSAPARSSSSRPAVSSSSSSQRNSNNFVVYDNPEQQNTDADYVLNTNTKKVHYPWCSEVRKIKRENYFEFYGSRSNAMKSGYTPCGKCNP